MNEAEARAFAAVEKLAVDKMDDAARVQYFQQRAFSAEDALKGAMLEKEAAEVVTKFPKVELGDLAGIKSRAEMEAVAARLQTKVEKAELAGQSVVEAAVKEALALKDEEIVNMRKVYGKPRQAQAGDVTGAQTQQIAAAAKEGIGAEAAATKIELGSRDAVIRAAAATVKGAARSLGFGE